VWPAIDPANIALEIKKVNVLSVLPGLIHKAISRHLVNCVLTLIMQISLRNFAILAIAHVIRVVGQQILTVNHAIRLYPTLLIIRLAFAVHWNNMVIAYKKNA